jgi:hypothetical protein
VRSLLRTATRSERTTLRASGEYASIFVPPVPSIKTDGRRKNGAPISPPSATLQAMGVKTIHAPANLARRAPVGEHLPATYGWEAPTTRAPAAISAHEAHTTPSAIGRPAPCATKPISGGPARKPT